MKNRILEIVETSIDLKRKFFADNTDRILQTVNLFCACLASGHKIMLFGNGGSAADAQHIAAEFVNRFRIERIPLPALSLTTDTSVITSIGNDYGFDDIFHKQLAALGRQDDVAVGISTSGNSRNVIAALKTARRMDIRTVAFSGSGGRITDFADIVFAVDSRDTARIQEIHIMLGHMLCELTERTLFPR